MIPAATLIKSCFCSSVSFKGKSLIITNGPSRFAGGAESRNIVSRKFIARDFLKGNKLKILGKLCVFTQCLDPTIDFLDLLLGIAQITNASDVKQKRRCSRNARYRATRKTKTASRRGASIRNLIQPYSLG